jgi:uncharacterized protein (DUF362 family)
MAVAIRKGLELEKNITELFAELNFLPGKSVFIKPNLSGRAPVLPGENTSIEVMDALINVLKSAGVEKIVIGHGELLPSVDHQTTWQETLDSSGYIKYVGRKDVEMLNLDTQERQEVKIEELTFHLPLNYIKSFDSYINLPKIKTHMEATISFSLKNQMGLPSKMDRVMMHKTNLEVTIAKLAQHCVPTISLLEGYPAMENNGPHHGTPTSLNFMAAGDDMVELDSFVAELLGFESAKIPHLVNANGLGVGKFFDVTRLREFGDYLVNDFHKAKQREGFGKTVFAYPTYSCSRCIYAVNNAGKEFKKHPLKNWRFLLKALFSKNKTYIVFGHADQLQNPIEVEAGTNIICVGACAKNFAEQYGLECLEKCPPTIAEVQALIKRKV